MGAPKKRPLEKTGSTKKKGARWANPKNAHQKKSEKKTILRWNYE